VFDFGQAAIARLEARWRQAVNELEALAVEARSEVREARDLVTANRELARYYREVLLPQRIQVVNTMQLQFNAMQRTPTDLLLAKERELNTERGYIDAWRDYWIARAELEMALKGGSPSGAGGNSRRRESRSERPSIAPLGQGDNPQ
jgi:cobalt-zinc-cadmium efflux system outer membrane protein